MTHGANHLLMILESIRDSRISCDQAYEKLDSFSWQDFPYAEHIACNLNHYWSDQDIRMKDSEYCKMQDLELSKLIGHLHKENYQNAGEISFLGAS